MHTYAQTCPQLFNQLREERNLAALQLEMMHRAYMLGMRLFSGMYRPSGKPFVAHVVGTASILIRAGAAIEVVAGGLLHSAYDNGDFGGARRGLTARNRNIVRDAVGEDVEDYIARYARFDWNHRRFDEIVEAIPNMGTRDREVVRMRLADKLEDHLDLAMLYCQSAPKQRSFQNRRDQMIRMAELLEDAFLASEHRRVSEAINSGSDAGLRFAPTDGSFLLPPPSYHIRPHFRLARFIFAISRRIRRRAERTIARRH